MNQDELSKYMVALEQYKEQIGQYEYQNQYVQAAINDYNKAKITLEELVNKKEKNNELLVPIGGSTFISVKSDAVSKVLFDIGAGIVAEKKTEEAIKRIDERIENLQKTLEKINTTISQIQSEAEEVSQKAQELYENQQMQ